MSQSTRIPTIAVGATIDPEQAVVILRDGRGDLVALGRQLTAEPHWLYRAARGLEVSEPHAIPAPYYGFHLKRRAALLEA